VGVIAMAVLLRHYLPKSRFLQPMVLEPPEGLQAAEQSARESLANYRHLMDAEGATITPLTPAGKARFGDEVVDVISDGQWISAGSPIVVVAVRGSRVEVAERG
jgi:membrane-bound ClpP family serine protease